MIRVADYIIKRIGEEGVKHIFYVPGGQCVYLTDALRRSKNIEPIAMHHEQSVAMAALSYALYNQNFGACIVTTGCAGTNTMTGLLHAWQDSIPCIFISGQQNYSETIEASGLPLRQVGIQETDIIRIVKPLTKYAAMVKNPKAIVEQLDKAIYISKHGRKGPVWLDIPLNVQNSMIDEDTTNRLDNIENDIDSPEYIELQEANIEDIICVAKMLNNAKRPVIIAGAGVRSSGAIEELEKFIDKIKIPVTLTRFAADLLDYRNKCYFGVMGSLGPKRYANFIVQNADLIICIGTRLSIDTTGSDRDSFGRFAKIVVVDIDKIEHSKSGVKIDKLILSDAGKFLRALNNMDIKETDSEWFEKCVHWEKIFPSYTVEDMRREPINVKYFLDVLTKNLPENAAVISDAGMTGVATAVNCLMKKSNRMIHSFAQGEMGYCLPGALGIATICPIVVAVSGDGSFMMNLQELQTLTRTGYNVKIIINNNNGYSGVRHGQKAHFRGKSIGTDSSNGIDFPDYEKISIAFNIPYIKIENSTDIDIKLKKLLKKQGPCLCEVICDPDQIELHNGLVMYGKRKFGFRPIEDQAPYIEREVFFNEMLVEPMETSSGVPI